MIWGEPEEGDEILCRKEILNGSHHTHYVKHQCEPGYVITCVLIVINLENDNKCCDKIIGGVGSTSIKLMYGPAR